MDGNKTYHSKLGYVKCDEFIPVEPMNYDDTSDMEEASNDTPLFVEDDRKSDIQEASNPHHYSSTKTTGNQIPTTTRTLRMAHNHDRFSSDDDDDEDFADGTQPQKFSSDNDNYMVRALQDLSLRF